MSNSETETLPHFPLDSIREYPSCSGKDPMTMEEELRFSDTLHLPEDQRSANHMTYIQTWYLFRLQDILKLLPLSPATAAQQVLPVLLGNPLGRFRMERVGYHLSPCTKPTCPCQQQKQPDLAMTVSPVCFTTDKVPQEYWPFTLWQICTRRVHEIGQKGLQAIVRQTTDVVIEKTRGAVRHVYRMQTMIDEIALMRIYFCEWLEFANLWVKSDSIVAPTDEEVKKNEPAPKSLSPEEKKLQDEEVKKNEPAPKSLSPEEKKLQDEQEARRFGKLSFMDQVREFPLYKVGANIMTIYEELKAHKLLKLNPSERTVEHATHLHSWYLFRLQDVMKSLPLSPVLKEHAILPVLMYNPSGRFRLERVGYHLSPCSKSECECQKQPDLAMTTSPVCFTSDKIPQGYWPFTLYQLCARKVNIGPQKTYERMTKCIETVFTRGWPTVKNRYRMRTMLDEMRLVRLYFIDWLQFANPWKKTRRLTTNV